MKPGFSTISTSIWHVWCPCKMFCFALVYQVKFRCCPYYIMWRKKNVTFKTSAKKFNHISRIDWYKSMLMEVWVPLETQLVRRDCRVQVHLAPRTAKHGAPVLYIQRDLWDLFVYLTHKRYSLQHLPTSTFRALLFKVMFICSNNEASDSTSIAWMKLNYITIGSNCTFARYAFWYL